MSAHAGCPLSRLSLNPLGLKSGQVFSILATCASAAGRFAEFLSVPQFLGILRERTPAHASESLDRASLARSRLARSFPEAALLIRRFTTCHHDLANSRRDLAERRPGWKNRSHL